MRNVAEFLKAFFSVLAIGLLIWIVSICSGCTFELYEVDEKEDAVQCRVDSECDDDNNCTADTCSDAGECAHVYLPDLLCPSEGPEPETESEWQPCESNMDCSEPLDQEQWPGSCWMVVCVVGQCLPVPADYDQDGHTPVFCEYAEGPGDDCGNNDPNIHPGAEELCDDNVDNDCDGEIDEGCEEEPQCETNEDCSEFDSECLVFRCIAGGCFAYERDEDGDGHSLCGGLPEGQRYDCDDSDPTVYPGAVDTVDDGIDNDCDGEVDECHREYRCRDEDEDGNGDPRYCGWVCRENAGVGVLNDDDCDDSDPTVHFGAEEICDDGVDNNCDGVIDECGDGRS